MKYSSTAIKELNARYGKILRKCALLNAAVLMTVALTMPANAAAVSEGQAFSGYTNSDSNNQQAAGLTITFGDALDNNGVNNVKFTNNTSVNSGAAMKALNGFTAGDGWTFDNNKSDKISGGLYVKIPNSGSENRIVSFGNNTTFSNNSSKWLGGALGIEAADTVTLGDNASFTSNHSDTDGGAIAVWTDSTNTNVTTGTTLNLGKTTFDGNTAAKRGGALANLNNDTVATAYFNTVNIGAGSSFTNNSAVMGGAIYNIGTMNVSDTTFEGNNASYVGGAMFLAADSDTTISNALFKENKSTTGWGGAIYTSSNMKNLVISDSEFLNNEARGTGALGIYNKATLTNVSFSNNKATDATDEGGGAISLGAESVVQLTNGTFTGNTSAQDGGAITMRAADIANNSAAKLDIENSSFSGNIAATRGGAIYSTFYNSQKAVSSVYIANTTFTSNNAKEGGAIYNDGTADAQNNLSAIKLENATFTDNIATTKGGALFNAANGTVTLSGTNTFSGNTADGVKNDIHNDGTLNVSGLLALDGGITGTGTVNFLEGSSLKAALNAETAIIKAGTITGETAFVLENGSEGGTITLSGVQTDFKFLDNALYTITDDDNGTYTFAKKSSEEIVASTGATGSEAAAVSGVTSGTSSNEEFNAVANDINTMLQSSDAAVVAQGVKAAATLAPSDAPVVQSQATQTVSQILAAASSRLSSGISTSAGESSGDMIMGDGAVWVKGLYNKSKLSGKNGFDSHSKGLALGAEAQLTDAVKVGLGYAYTNSEIKPELRKNEVDSNSALLYAEYKPNNWFLNGIASYTWGSYDEHKYVAGSDISADYDVNSIALQAMTGYDIKANAFTFTPEAGLRYMNIHQKSYTDSVDNHVKENKSDILTGVFGLKTVMDWEVSKSVVLKPELRAAVTYDFVHDDATSVMTMANGSVVSVEGKALKRFGTEFGAGFLTDIGDNIELGIFWEGKFREDYTDNTGMINLKYAF